MLTDEASYLQPYRSAAQRVHTALDWLDQHYDGEPGKDEVIDRIREAADGKLSELSETIRLHDEGKHEAWRSVIRSNIGKEKMDTVRALGEKLFDDESNSVLTDRAALNRALQFNRIGVTVMTLLGLASIWLYLRQTTALVRLRERQRQAMQEERDVFARELLQRTAQLTDLNRHLQTVREDERQHLARELHDELGALLTAAKLDVARLKSRLGVVGPEVIERLKHLSDGLNSGIALKRRIIEDLRPSSLSNLGLVAALEILVREWSQRADIKVNAKFERVQLRASGQLTVYRLVQEALTNITKYAKASEVEIRMSPFGSGARITVRDNGVGFDVEAPRTITHGLLGMRYRLETENGNLVMQSTPGRGTLIRADLPESFEVGEETATATDRLA